MIRYTEISRDNRLHFERDTFNKTCGNQSLYICNEVEDMHIQNIEK